MKVLTPAFADHFKPDVLPEARGLYRENRVYNLKEEDSRLRVFVLGDQPMPFEVQLHSRSGQFYWSCECGSLEPCVHLAALFFKGASAGFAKDHWFLGLPQLDLVPEKLTYEESDSPQGDLFSSSPQAPLSRHSKPSRREGQGLPVTAPAGSSQDSGSDIPLFQGLSDDDFHLSSEAPRYDLVFTLSGNADSGIRVRPALLRLREGQRSGGILRYKASRPVSALTGEQKILLDRLCSSRNDDPEEALPLEDCLEDVLTQKELFTSGRIGIKTRQAASLEVSFCFQELLHDDRPLYYPEYRFLDSRGAVLHLQRSRSGLILRNKRVFCLDEEEGVLAFLPEDSNTSFFVNLILSKSQGFLPADIQGILRLTGKMKHHSLKLNSDYPPVSVRQADPLPVLKLRSRQDKTETFFFFRYGHKDIPYQSPVSWIPPGETEGAAVLVIQKRNKERETSLVKDVISQITNHLSFEKGYYAGLVSGNEEGDLRLDLSLEEFLTYYSTMLSQRGIELQLEDRKISTSASVQFNVGNTTDWLDVNAMVKEPDTEELKALFFDDHYQTLGLISTGDSYVRLSESDLRKLEFLRRQGMDDDGKLATSVRNFSVIDQIYEQIAGRDESPADEILEQARQIREAGVDDQTSQPAGLKATLRPYQKSGFNWLLRLHQNDCHGCLADDMGLGKTLQTLCLLQYLKERGELSTSLLVAPVVTLANWESEIEKFAPGLTYTRHAGAGRISEALHFEEHDLIIVSYHTLRNDVDLFLEYTFDYIILDEAHYIKNAGSRIFKAIRSLKSGHRLSLTGTPLENNTMELWSQFSFLNPGLLGGRKDFFNRFAQPIEKKRDSEALTILRDTVSPFMLRRKKEDVLDELPPKEIIVHYSEMIPGQAELYHKYRDFYRARVTGLIGDKGLSGASVEIFQFLLKLRQLAIYPPMTGDEEAMTVGSCKMEALKDLLDEVLEEDHKILIFSQFLGTLDAIGDFCRNQHWDYSRITGKTKDRAGEIRRFQEDEDVKVFLLSLKAGGVGINLTAADYVVLFDPWWNPAAERQAIDRAHRMGQKRRVISYKMIVRGTIEEKILRMQEQKTALMDGIIQDDRNIYGSLGEEDVIRLFE